MKRHFILFHFILSTGFGSWSAQAQGQSDHFVLPPGKAIYQPKEFAGQDWYSDTCRYSYRRMSCTDNLSIFWEKGFGNDLAAPPDLEGHPMAVDLENLKYQLERFYLFYRDSLKFVKPGSQSEKYRMMAMIQYSLEGTAYGGDYDQVIGAFWATPNRLQDKRLNAVAHELGHSFQLQSIADGEGVAWGGNGIFEMGAQWMLWQVNPHWIDDETYHWDAFKKNTHKAFLHTENIYRSPYILEYWSERQGLPFIGELFRQGKKGEDPVMTYKRMQNLSQEQFNDEMFDAYQHLINFDYKRVFSITRPWANSFPDFRSCLEEKEDGWYQVRKAWCPENYGFNAIHLQVPAAGTTVQITFAGLTPAGQDYNIQSPKKAGWRYGFVGVTATGQTIRGKVHKNRKGKVSFKTPKDQPLSHLWFVVMGAPAEHRMNPGWNPQGPQPTDAQWPYKIKVKGTEIL